jgi:hypothetical protein
MIWRYGDQIGWGPFVQGDQILGDHLSRGIKFDGDRLSRGIKFDGDRLSRVTKWVGNHLSMGTKFLGTICPWGQKVGDQKSGDQMGSGPNESQPVGNIPLCPSAISPFMPLIKQERLSNYPAIRIKVGIK